MFELIRGVGEAIRIGDDVEIKILSTAGGQIRFGIQAPRHVSIDREEIHLRKRADVESLVSHQPPAYPSGELIRPARRKTLYLRSRRQTE